MTPKEGKPQSQHKSPSIGCGLAETPSRANGANGRNGGNGRERPATADAGIAAAARRPAARRTARRHRCGRTTLCEHWAAPPAPNDPGYCWRVTAHPPKKNNDASSPAARQAARISRRWPLVSGGMGILLVAALGAIIAYRENNLPFSFDLAFLGELVEHRSAFWNVPALLMNNIGGGIIGTFVVPLAIILIFLVLRMKWAALYFAIATIVSAGLVQLLKNLYERPRPHDILVASDLGSFPSGHTANAATMAVVLSLVLRRVWIWAAGVVYTVIMLLSRTYLGAHWLSDTIGGLVLGSAVAVIVWAPLAHRLLTERERRSGPL